MRNLIVIISVVSIVILTYGISWIDLRNCKTTVYVFWIYFYMADCNRNMDCVMFA